MNTTHPYTIPYSAIILITGYEAWSRIFRSKTGTIKKIIEYAGERKLGNIIEHEGIHFRIFFCLFSQAVAYSLSFAQYFHGVEYKNASQSEASESMNYTLILKVRARMKPQPNTEIIPMLESIAIGPLISAPFVSSVKCAAESYPKREYWLTSHDISTP